MICVGTPSHDNGSLNLRFVENVCREIGDALATKQGYHVVVVRSTVLPGTVEEVLIPLLEQQSGRKAGADFGVCMVPEFLREGSAIEDFVHPSLVVIGELDRQCGEIACDVLGLGLDNVIRTSIRTAEMAKYASNAFHAMKVVFANEIGNICKASGLDSRPVLEILGKDRKLNISTAYLKPGFSFGGSCLPKDLRALLHRAKDLDLECPTLSGILPSNQKQTDLGIKLVEKTGRKKIGILGLSFKAGTDDLRESPAITLVETLLGRGYSVRIFDPEVQLARLVGANKLFLETELPHIASQFCSSIEQLVAESEVIVITNRAVAYERIYELISPQQVLIDLVGIPVNGRSDVSYQGICW
jgi:GDP-mannose 6-dehydrogenase